MGYAMQLEVMRVLNKEAPSTYNHKKKGKKWKAWKDDYEKERERKKRIEVRTEREWKGFQKIQAALNFHTEHWTKYISRYMRIAGQ